MSFRDVRAGENRLVTRRLCGAELLARPVRLNGIHLGRPVDVVVDAGATRVIGLDVRCGDDGLRFLPLAAARVGDDAIEVRSALLLLDEGHSSFYSRRTRRLRSLRGLAVERRGRLIGTLADIVLADDGSVLQLVLHDGGRVAYDDSVAVAGIGKASAA